ncbi:hypothetical protein E0Z10_g6891 [Xylaria hypoxylon]|uniref:Cytochrome P450 n=1 Tax=Xylaria hypoxylon TaxID=37992 RepID=A0A4Z0YZL7_9PEZI|nr:hypothetical protein E0Z10_g6891 [Xylaria hypoxylon]
MVCWRRWKGKRAGLTADEISGNIFAINFAGHDMIVIALHFALTLLAAHQDVQEWMHEDIIAVFGEPGNDEWAYGAFTKLNRCHAVFLETLRLFVPITGVPKMSTKRAVNLQVGDQTVPILPDIEAFPNLLGIQTDARYWGRALRVAAVAVDSTLWGSWRGRAKCVGEKFSQVEGVAVLARLLHHHQLRVERDDWETGEDAKARTLGRLNDVNNNSLLRMNHAERLKLQNEYNVAMFVALFEIPNFESTFSIRI